MPSNTPNSKLYLSRKRLDRSWLNFNQLEEQWTQIRKLLPVKCEKVYAVIFHRHFPSGNTSFDDMVGGM
jgi:hypothetical protein